MRATNDKVAYRHTFLRPSFASEGVHDPFPQTVLTFGPFVQEFATVTAVSFTLTSS